MSYNGYNEARKKANNKYLAKFQKIEIRVLPEEKKKIEAAAAAAGQSVAQYIKDRVIPE